MDFWDLTKLLFRRWWVSVPLLSVTLAGTVAAAMLIEPDYVATSYVQLIPPSTSIREPESKGKVKIVRNPWLDTGLNSLAKASLLTVQDAKVAEQLDAVGFSQNYTITLDNQLPILTFEVVGVSRDQASKTTDELVKRFEASNLALQKEFNAPSEQMVSTRRLDMGDNITLSTSKTKRALVAIFGSGLLIAVASTVAVDAILRRRRRKQTTGDETPAEEPQERPGVPASFRIPARAATGERRSGDVTPAAVRIAPNLEETARLQRPGEAGGDSVGESTIVLPSSWVKQNGRAKPR
ncbi:hypothetical protein Ade02nite_59390 [Paractinoplanes deccanensis]|uniref:Polysaccharide chain length determinant N-terminal domain-containing protein n=1 Tax=Paractinoplanes deccanensis TaxID=113561 RepID=A0ABQ3YBE4_9ACTN|nr:hypothetical protein Ade02nite_59390 [Actinoplanes deccanensis]